MQLVANRRVILPVGFRTLEDFLEACNSRLENRKAAFGTFELGLVEVCVPDGLAMSSGSIDELKCFGCLACVEQKDGDYLTIATVPSDDPSGVKIQDVALTCFQGKYVIFNTDSGLARHSGGDEERVTNPLGTIFIWQLSENSLETFFCCSPSTELSIEKAKVIAEREGHLDITLASLGKKSLFVLEGKKSVTGFIRDAPREQWKQYSPTVRKLAKTHSFECTFSYLIGGDELAMYPPSVQPHSPEHDMFRKIVEEDSKRFISLESLRALKAWKLSVDNGWTWEEHLVPLFKDPCFIGLVAGGTIMRRDGDWVLEKAPWA
jgi:hypothetical protein